jgi:hypothetical protein
MRRPILAVATLVVALVLPASAMASTTPWNLVGTYTIPFTCVTGCSSPPDYPYSVTIDTSSTSTGAVTGTGFYITGAGDPAVTVTGQVTGSHVALSLLYTRPDLNGYNPFNLTGTIGTSGAMSGTATDGQGRTFTWKTTTGTATLTALRSHQKTPLVRYPAGRTVGAVIFESERGHQKNLQMTVQLKHVARFRTYDVYLFLDSSASGAGVRVGTVRTNGRGNATFHKQVRVAPGVHSVSVDVTRHGSGADVFVTPGLYAQNLFMVFR